MFLIFYLLQLSSIFLPGNTNEFKTSITSLPSWKARQANLKKYYSFRDNASLTNVLSVLDPDLELFDSDSDSIANYKTPYRTVPPTGFETQNAAKSNILNPLLSAKSAVNRKKTYKYGTTRHLKEIFLGRCFEYQYRKGVLEENEWNCTALWELFHDAFAFKGPCSVSSEDYLPLLDRIDESIQANRGLLWSGTRELAHKFSDFLFTGKYTTLEDTLAGYLLNGLTWCGHPKYGINFKECPWSCSLQSPYWSVANSRFAQKLSGLVHIILNGTRMHLNDGNKYPTYMKNRYYLGPNVVPVLNKDKINKIIIVVAHTLGMKPLEKCGEKSVKVLVEEIEKKGIPVECVNDPDAARHVQCASDPDAKECRDVSVRHYVPPGDIGRLFPMLSGKKIISGML